jgi:hypothetical protein
LTLLTEDAVEGILAGSAGWGDGKLNLHQIGPSRVGIYTEGLYSILDTGVDVIDGAVQLGYNNQN